MKNLLLLATILFVTSSQFVFAEVTTPYVVDEKAQVLFGDSTLISATSTYYGMENYVHEYVDGFVHITFTYTHHGCCFASYPPALYITDVDPTSTTTQMVRNFYPVYQLSSQPTHLTGWYAYDIQFDETGYTALVKQAGETEIANFHNDIAGIAEGDWAALANGKPRQDPITEFSMSFTPLRIRESMIEPVATRTPVIVVPGIMGSKLVDHDSSEVWPSFPLMLFPGLDDFLNILVFSVDGQSIEDILPGSILSGIGNVDFFQGLFAELGNYYVEDESLFDHPYDWRLDITSSSLELKNKIDNIKIQRGVETVNLVAHSMGGLIVKKYLKDYGGDSVNRFVDIGTPHTGAPKAFKILNYGDNFGFEKFGFDILNPIRTMEISQNMPSVYQLLPSQRYFDESESNYYVFNGSNGNNRLTYSQTSDYMKAEGRNGALVDRAKEFHEEIDNLNPGDYGVETYNIVGCGTPTIGQFYILDDDADHPIYNIHMINGDGTVPLRSAEAMTASTTYYLRNATHALMPSTSGVKELVAALLTSTTTPDISSYSNLSLDSNGCTIPNGKIVSFHSPIELHVYDPSNNHVGPNADGDIENNIPGVSYEEIDGNKFAYLPDGLEYSIRGNATGEGSFDVRIQEVLNGEVATTTLFHDIPLTLTTQAQFNIGSLIPTQIELDNDNDNAFESSASVSVVTQGFLESTGKVAAAPPQPEIRSSSGNSKPVLVEEVATTTPEAVPVQEVELEAPVLQVLPVVGSPEVFEVTPQPQETSYENSAIVYKSFGYKVTIFFKKLWAWFISKL